MKKLYHKFKAKRVEEDGIKFPSTLEYKYYKHLQLLQKTGEVIFFLRQIPFYLPGGVRYVVDFQVFNSDGTVDFVDVKGMATETFKIKAKIVEDLYPVSIKIVKKGEF